MPDGITQCYLAAEPATWFSDPGGMQGWVCLVWHCQSMKRRCAGNIKAMMIGGKDYPNCCMALVLRMFALTWTVRHFVIVAFLPPCLLAFSRTLAMACLLFSNKKPDIYIYYCDVMVLSWWDRSLTWTSIFILQCCDTVRWVLYL